MEEQNKNNTTASDAVVPEATSSVAPMHDTRIFIPFAIIGLFVIVLIASFFIKDGDKKNDEIPLPTSTRNASMIIEPAPVPAPVEEVTSPTPTPRPSIAPMPQPNPVINASFGVPLIPGTIAYDLNRDGVLTNGDVGLLAQFVDQGRYAAVFDLDADGKVDKNDLGLIRAALLEYPVVAYDMNGDQRINGEDIGLVAQFIDQGRYAAIFDFNADGKVDIKDLALIRDAVADSGSIATPAP